MPNVQRRLPGEDWSAFSTQRKSAFSPGQQAPQEQQGQLFSTKRYEQKQEPEPTGYKWARPHDRPIGPEPSQGYEQPRLTPFQKPPEPSPFAKSGLRKYVVKNGNGVQFNKPAVTKAVDNITMGLAASKHYRHVGFGEGLRTSFGLPPIPSHYNDYVYARHNQDVRGRDPGSFAAQRSSFDPDTYLHF